MPTLYSQDSSTQVLLTPDKSLTEKQNLMHTVKMKKLSTGRNTQGQLVGKMV